MSSKQNLNDFESVNIDPSGRYKYILIKLEQNGQEKYVVRGHGWAEYHGKKIINILFWIIYFKVFEICAWFFEADILENFEQAVKSKDIRVTCTGGGRILHEPSKILVYGYSQGFGRAEHEISVSLIKEKYPDYQSITFSNEGY